MTDPFLKVRSLNAGYGDSQVVSGVSFEVKRGETVTLIGRNGVGKTTTLRALMGIIQMSAGSVHLDGRDLTKSNSIQRARAGIAIVPEDRGIFSSLSVEENMLLPPAVSPGGFEMDELYELFPNLKEHRHSSGNKLSGGEQQMLAIARVLRTGARLILLDEPTEGLAPVIVERIGETLKAIQTRGITVILVEQNFRWARKLSDRFLLMDHGKIVGEVTAENFNENRALIDKTLSV